MADAVLSSILETLLQRFSETVRVTNKLIETSSTINNLLTDAVEQITREDVKDWFDDVQDVLHEAEDLLDEIHWEDRRLQVESGSGSRSNKIQNFFSSLLTCHREDNVNELVRNLKNIFPKIKELEKQGLSLGLDGRDYGGDTTLSDMKSKFREFPSDLQRRFVYCAVFPKGYYFRREELVLLWLADDFLDFYRYRFPNFFKKARGYRHFQELVGSSFFVQASDDSPYFKLHEGIYDWAKSISRNYCVSLDDGDSLSRKTSHIWCLDKLRRYEDHFMTNIDGDRMRTILPMSNECFWKDINDEEIGRLLLKFKHLRVLSLSNRQELPDSIGTIKLLRYLNLSGAAVKKLPESVGSLFNLEILILRQCRDLVELPANIANLTELCHLDIRETRLQQMPPHIGKLKKLETLTDFFVGEETGCNIDELEKLGGLRGEIHIWNLQNVSDAPELGFFMRFWLEEIELRWSRSGADDSLLQQDVLKRLQPFTAVERLSITGYGGKKFPRWVGSSSFSKIVDLKLSECHYCSSLPPIGRLSSLKKLVVQAFYRVEKIGPEFYGRSTSTRNPFPSLKTLTFERMLQLREWQSHAGENQNTAFPCLEVLCIRKCPNLANKTMPIHRPLVELEITKCQRLELPLSELPTTDKLLLGDDFHKMVLDHHLQSLAVDSFHSLDSILKEIELWGYSCTFLQKIEITRSPLQSFPPESYPALKQLNISRCPNLESLCAQHLTSLESLELRECPKLKSMPEESLPSSLISLSIMSCPLLEQRCQRNTGEDWHKISRIPKILIGGHEINREV